MKEFPVFLPDKELNRTLTSMMLQKRPFPSYIFGDVHDNDGVLFIIFSVSALIWKQFDM